MNHKRDKWAIKPAPMPWASTVFLKLNGKTVAQVDKDVCQRFIAIWEKHDELVKVLRNLERVSGLAMMQDDPTRAAARAILSRYPEQS